MFIHHHDVLTPKQSDQVIWFMEKNNINMSFGVVISMKEIYKS